MMSHASIFIFTIILLFPSMARGEESPEATKDTTPEAEELKEEEPKEAAASQEVTWEEVKIYVLDSTNPVEDRIALIITPANNS